MYIAMHNALCNRKKGRSVFISIDIWKSKGRMTAWHHCLCLHIIWRLGWRSEGWLVMRLSLKPSSINVPLYLYLQAGWDGDARATLEHQLQPSSVPLKTRAAALHLRERVRFDSHVQKKTGKYFFGAAYVFNQSNTNSKHALMVLE